MLLHIVRYSKVSERALNRKDEILGKVRSIRLKEADPSTDVWHTPAPTIREASNDTLQSGPFHARTDSNGFLMTGNPSTDETPVVFLGDSFVESMFADEQVRFISQLERMIPYRCHNGGYSGSTTLQLFNVLVNKVYPVVGLGGKVVFFVGQSDADYLGKPETYWTDHPRGTTLVPPKAPEGALPDGLYATQRVTQMVLDVSRTLGIDLVLALSPYSTPDFNSDRAIRNRYKRNREQYETVLARRGGIADVVREVAADNDVPFIDGHAFINGDPGLFYDELHLNETGHNVFAKFLASELTKLY